MKYFLITTAHLESGLWFKDDEDYRTGMNYAAVLSFLTGIKILAFILMSNHVHFVAACLCSREGEQFINGLKKKYSHYFSRKYRIRELLRGNKIDIRPVCIEDESFEKAVAYVQMNSVAANICLNPADYPWGTGSCFFNVSPVKGIPLKALSERKKRRILHTAVTLPPEWKMSADGYLAPGSFVDVRLTESVFRSPKRMNYFLFTSSKARQKTLLQEHTAPSFRDEVLAQALTDLCRSLFKRGRSRIFSQSRKAKS